jgi:hypothetical protein
LRDTAASLAIQEDASVVAVARLLGYESAATILNHYAGLFPTDLEDIASRVNTAARLTIASHGASSDAEPSPTKAPTRTSQHQSAGNRKPPLTCTNSLCPRQDSNLRHRL